MDTEKLFDKERNLGSITMNNGSTIFFEIQHDPEDKFAGCDSVEYFDVDLYSDY